MAQVYRGAIGRTQTAAVHVTDPRGALVAVQVTTSVDATHDPELVEQLLGDTLNVARVEGAESMPLAVPVIYHDPSAEVMVLVLGPAHRHRELEERIAVLEQLRRDAAAIPPYAKDFAVAFGGAGLRAYLAQRALLRDAEAELAQLRGEARPGDTDRFEVPPVPDESGEELSTGELTELPIDGAAEAVQGGVASRVESGCHVDRTGVHLVAIAAEPTAIAATGALDVRLVLHRTPSYPVIALVVGPPVALRAATVAELVVVPFDVAAEADRAVLDELARRFVLTIELWARGRRFRRCMLTAPLAENVAYILHAADDHLRRISAAGEPDYGRARALVLGAGFDLLGAQHPEHAEFRDDKLAQIATAQQLRRALAVARRFTRHAREDYLVCTRSFPLPRWQKLRRDIVVRAVAWGLWMGPELAQLAVAEGLAQSHSDLIGKLDRGFETLRHDADAFDLDADAAADNAAAIAGEARALRVELRPVKPNGAGAIASDTAPVVSGSIVVTPSRGTPRVVEACSTEQLLAQLEEAGGDQGGGTQRVAAALALCDRADPRAARPVIAAAMKMSRREAVRVLAMAVKFGDAAKPALLDGLASSKAFLRHGSALALALLRSEDATHAVIELLLTEPTELWREIARAIGQIGNEALAPLVRQYERLGERVAAEDRVAWAMAHIGVRGGKPSIEAMAAEQSIVTPIATKALDLLALAADDRISKLPDASAFGSRSGRDLTVNHAFSRQFFEALDQGLPEPTAEGDIAAGAGEAGEP